MKVDRILRTRSIWWVSPPALITFTWVIVVFLRSLPLIDFAPVSGDLWLVAGASYVAFVACFWIANRPLVRNPVRQQWWLYMPAENGLNFLVALFAAIGILGATARGVDFYFLRGLDFSEGIGAARLANISHVEQFGAGQSGLSAFGRIFAGFATVACMVTMLRYENLKRETVYLSILSLVWMLLLSVIEGGRNTIAVNLMLVGSCFIVRRGHGWPAIPWGTAAKSVSVIAIIGIFIFFFYVFIDRFSALGYLDSRDAFEGMERGFNVDIARWLKASDSGVLSNIYLGGAGIILYVTHGLNELGWVIEWSRNNTPAWGAYNLDLVVLALEKLGLEGLRFNYNSLDRPGVYMTALGGVILDFGLPGSVLISTLLGLLAGYCWMRIKYRTGMGVELLTAYGLAAILTSPLFSILPSFIGILAAIGLFNLLITLGGQKLCL